MKAEFEKVGLGKFMSKEEPAVGAGAVEELPGAPEPPLKEPGIEKPAMPRQEPRKPEPKKAKTPKKEAVKEEKKEIPLDEGSIPASEGELVF